MVAAAEVVVVVRLVAAAEKEVVRLVAAAEVVWAGLS